MGKYTLERPIGSGGMGEVHLASTSGPDGLTSQVAIKLICPTLLGSELGRELFLQEGRAMAALSHRNIVEVIELGDEGYVLYLAMEYLRGVDLGRAVRRGGALPWQLAVYAVAEAARGVAAAHDRHIVHGDVTPSNVFLCADGAVKVLDFGLARSAVGAPGVEGGSVRGVVPYLPPEVLRGAAADARADVYGLGAVLHECLTGQPPFGARNDPETVWRALRDPLPAPSELVDVPRDLDRVVADAMARDKAGRTRSAQALADQLDGILGGAFTAADLARWVAERPEDPSEAPRACGHSKREPPPPPATWRRRPALWLAAVGAAALIAAGLLYLAS